MCSDVTANVQQRQSPPGAEIISTFLRLVAFKSYLLKEFIILKGIHEGWWCWSVARHSFWFCDCQAWFRLASCWLGAQRPARFPHTSNTLNCLESFQLVFKTIIGLNQTNRSLFFVSFRILEIRQFFLHLIWDLRRDSSCGLDKSLNFLLPGIGVSFVRGAGRGGGGGAHGAGGGGVREGEGGGAGLTGHWVRVGSVQSWLGEGSVTLDGALVRPAIAAPGVLLPPLVLLRDHFLLKKQRNWETVSEDNLWRQPRPDIRQTRNIGWNCEKIARTLQHYSRSWSYLIKTGSETRKLQWRPKNYLREVSKFCRSDHDTTIVTDLTEVATFSPGPRLHSSITDTRWPLEARLRRVSLFLVIPVGASVAGALEVGVVLLEAELAEIYLIPEVTLGADLAAYAPEIKCHQMQRTAHSQEAAMDFIEIETHDFLFPFGPSSSPNRLISVSLSIASSLCFLRRDFHPSRFYK